MKIDSVRELKQGFAASLLGEAGAIHASALRLMPAHASLTSRSALPSAVRSLALGIAPSGKNDFKLAVRIQRRGLEETQEVERLVKKARGEADVQFVGRIQKQATPWTQKRQRPLLIGCSVGHFKITAGTLGCFVQPKGGGPLMMLSNNHVLANENAAKKGDAILQPGTADGGGAPLDQVASLSKFVRLRKGQANKIDAAVAELGPDIDYHLSKLKGLGSLKGQGPDFLDDGTEVAKVGRTTVVTRGKVTAFELDNVVVAYDIGNIRFDNQIEIEGSGSGPFSQGGDSGSVIIDSDGLAVALLFAGGEVGGTNGQGLTYANPIQTVLDDLDIELSI